MLESFTPKKEGDLLSHEEVNDLFAVAGRTARWKPGAHRNGNHGTTGFSDNGSPPWVQHTVVVSSDELMYEDAYSGMFYCKIREYNHVTRRWETQEQEWILDASDYALIDDDITAAWEATYAVQVRSALLMEGDRISVWWDRQREAFVPVSCPTTIRWAKLDYTLYGAIPDDIGYTGSGWAPATIWKRSQPIRYVAAPPYYGYYYLEDWEVTTIKVAVYAPPFMGINESIAANAFIAITNMQSEYIWYVIGAPGEVLTECTPI